MGKKKNAKPDEGHLILPVHPSRSALSEAEHTPTVDTHTHLLSTFSSYRSAYKTGKHETIFDFVRAMYHGRRVAAIVDVWCEAPVQKSMWKEIADSALTAEQRERDWGGIEYWFVMGASVSTTTSYSSKCYIQVCIRECDHTRDRTLVLNDCTVQSRSEDVQRCRRARHVGVLLPSH